MKGSFVCVLSLLGAIPDFGFCSIPGVLVFWEGVRVGVRIGIGIGIGIGICEGRGGGCLRKVLRIKGYIASPHIV